MIAEWQTWQHNCVAWAPHVYIYIYEMHSVCLIPVLFLCANNYEIHMFVLIKNGGNLEKRCRMACLELAVSMIRMKILYIHKPIIILDEHLRLIRSDKIHC